MNSISASEPERASHRYGFSDPSFCDLYVHKKLLLLGGTGGQNFTLFLYEKGVSLGDGSNTQKRRLLWTAPYRWPGRTVWTKRLYDSQMILKPFTVTTFEAKRLVILRNYERLMKLKILRIRLCCDLKSDHLIKFTRIVSKSKGFSVNS